jgi:hypothetical protein
MLKKLIKPLSRAARLGEAAQETSGRGALYFGYFLLLAQKKVTRQSGETDKYTSDYWVTLR